jgi:ACS family allantoate permease-like MFS transporter
VRTSQRNLSLLDTNQYPDITYMCFEFPSTVIMQRYKMGLSLSVYMILWGVCVLCIGFCQNFTQLLVLRALQGAFECSISPGFLLLVGTWYTRREHTSRSLVFRSSNAGFGVIAKLIMYGIGSSTLHKSGAEPWRYISFVSYTLLNTTLFAKRTSFLVALP